ncbi:nuclear transport factor 2 family protein [Roseibium sp.]|uniref:nuclear transport factor 2 family protein n=1 Tax=Roseibium sp. TaxID=1936156 RepID=UPI003D13D922
MNEDGNQDEGNLHDTDGLEKAMAAFGEAWACGVIETLKTLLSPSHTHNDLFGRHLPYKDWLDYATGRSGRTTRIAFRDVAVRRFGNVAVVTGFNDMTGDGATSPEDTKDLSIAFTQVWRLEDGRWLREAFQATPVVSQLAR